MDPVDIDADGLAVDGEVVKNDTVKPPTVRVGNILGLRMDTVPDNPANLVDDTIGLQYYGPDTIDRDFIITPEVVYEGETDEDIQGYL